MPRDGAATRKRILDAAQGLVIQRGFAGTSVDAVLAAASATKGGFFHHFPSKQALEDFMATAEAESHDAAQQLVAFVRLFEEGAAELTAMQPGCLFVSFIYERELTAPGTEEIIAATIRAWRERVLGKLEQAAGAHPPAADVDLPSLADQIFTTFEGGFVLARAMDEPDHLRRQLAHVRHYLELLFQVAPVGFDRLDAEEQGGGRR